MISTLLLALALVGANPAPQQASTQPVAHSVCALLKQQDFYDGKEVSVESLLVAGRHGAVLAGKTCGRIYISHEAGQTEGKWPQFDDALVKKATGLETRPLKVNIRGIFHARVAYGKTTIRQIEVLEVLDVSFLPKS
jgi:hypothetical protein